MVFGSFENMCLLFPLVLEGRGRGAWLELAATGGSWRRDVVVAPVVARPRGCWRLEASSEAAKPCCGALLARAAAAPDFRHD